MHVRSLAFRTDLLLRRLAGSVVIDHPSHLVVRTPANPHFWWGNFVLVPPHALPAAPDLFAAEFPEASHLAIGVDGTEGRRDRAQTGNGAGSPSRSTRSSPPPRSCLPHLRRKPTCAR
ncbi:hypothetical protein ACFQY7_43375 [Actinomadura luteofluorescens]|uniref:hypothetical protein n=1 Tax=Actinomadura luteofluorescens TaxID=46163 RepID=UPI0036317BBB